jgi:hypothetical protein
MLLLRGSKPDGTGAATIAPGDKESLKDIARNPGVDIRE